MTDDDVIKLIDELDGKGYRDPLGRDVTVHLAVAYLDAKDIDPLPPHPYSIHDLPDRGRYR